MHCSRGSRYDAVKSVWPSKGLVNGQCGTVRAILYEPGALPPALPKAVIVEFDSYTGPGFGGCPRHVSVTPRTFGSLLRGKYVERTQLPIRLA